jgi:hypothetical protein
VGGVSRPKPESADESKDIGENAAVFSWIEGILFRPYPAVAHQERLFALTGIARGETDVTGLSLRDFLDLQRSANDERTGCRAG